MMTRPRLSLGAVFVLGLFATQAGAAEVFWTESFGDPTGVLQIVSADWTFVSGESNTVISTGTNGSPSGNHVLDLPDSGTLARVDRNIGTVVEGKSYRMTGFLYAENPGVSLDMALMTLMSGGTNEVVSLGLDDGDLRLIRYPGTSLLNGQDNGTWQWYELIYHSIAAAADQIEVRIDGLPATVVGTPIGIVIVNADLSTSVDNSLRIQGRDPAAFHALHFDDVSWTPFEPITWTESFDYSTGVIHTVNGKWKLVSGNLDASVISNGTAGSCSGDNMLDLPDSGGQTRVDRDIGPVVEGTTYRMTGFIYAENPGDGADTAFMTLMRGSTEVVSLGLDAGAMKLFRPGIGFSVLDGQDNGTWQWYELTYRSIAAAADQIEVRIDGLPATVGASPLGIVPVTTDLSTTNGNSLRLQGRDDGGTGALHFDDVSWTLFEPGTWTESFDYPTGVIHAVAAKWELVSGNFNSEVISNGTAGSCSGDNMLDLPDTNIQARVERDIGPVVEGSTYRMTGFIYAETPAVGLDTALMTLMRGTAEVAGLGLDDGAPKLVVSGSPTLSLQGLAIGTWQSYELLYHAIAAAADQIEVRIDGLPATVGATPIGFVTVNTDLSTTNGNSLRLQGRDNPGFSALHIDDVSWTLFEPVTWTETFDYPTGVIKTVSAKWKLVSGNLDSDVITNGTAGSCSGDNMLDLPDSGSQTRVHRDIGPVVEGSNYWMTGFIYAENPADGGDVALMTLLRGSTTVASLGLDDGNLNLIRPGAGTSSLDGLATGTWQWCEMTYRSIAGATDEVEVRIDGLPATVGGIPVGIVTVTTDLSTTNGNTLRLQGRDPSAFGALHFDDVSWTLFEPVLWEEPFAYLGTVIHTVAAKWKPASANLDSKVIKDGPGGSPSGNNMLDLPDSGSQTRVHRDIGPVVEGSNYWMTGFIYGQNPTAGLDTALMTLLRGTNEVATLGLDDGAIRLIVPGSPTSSVDGVAIGKWQRYELIYRATAGASDQIEVRIDRTVGSVGGTPIGVVTVNTDLSTTNGNLLRIQGHDSSPFGALHFDDVSWGATAVGTEIAPIIIPRGFILRIR